MPKGQKWYSVLVQSVPHTSMVQIHAERLQTHHNYASMNIPHDQNQLGHHGESTAQLGQVVTPCHLWQRKGKYSNRVVSQPTPSHGLKNEMFIRCIWNQWRVSSTAHAIVSLQESVIKAFRAFLKNKIGWQTNSFLSTAEKCTALAWRTVFMFQISKIYHQANSSTGKHARRQAWNRHHLATKLKSNSEDSNTSSLKHNRAKPWWPSP